VSFGGGPGSELVGLIRYLEDEDVGENVSRVSDEPHLQDAAAWGVISSVRDFYGRAASERKSKASPASNSFPASLFERYRDADAALEHFA
jgi:hypothetical protein